jgi:hypothetical protein
MNSTGSRTIVTLDSATGKLDVVTFIGNGVYDELQPVGSPIDSTNRIIYSFLQAMNQPYELVGANILLESLCDMITTQVCPQEKTKMQLKKTCCK